MRCVGGRVQGKREGQEGGKRDGRLTELCRETLPDHPVEIMNYAARHSYFEILDAAAPLTISLPVSEVLKSLSGLFIVPYVRSTIRPFASSPSSHL